MFKEDFDKLCLLLERLNNNLEKMGDFITSFPFSQEIEEKISVITPKITEEIQPKVITPNIPEKIQPKVNTDVVITDDITDRTREIFKKLISQGYDKEKIKEKIKGLGVQTLVELSLEQQAILLKDLELIYNDLF